MAAAKTAAKDDNPDAFAIYIQAAKEARAEGQYWIRRVTELRIEHLNQLDRGAH